MHHYNVSISTHIFRQFKRYADRNGTVLEACREGNCLASNPPLLQPIYNSHHYTGREVHVWGHTGTSFLLKYALSDIGHSCMIHCMEMIVELTDRVIQAIE
mmetsp:Transcript_21625/g.31473  ORF Transcript_21625/g.31473 Transcript_21625/m.31473 type:complete len:101 (+) Transcript_21625:229-531(+)